MQISSGVEEHKREELFAIAMACSACGHFNEEISYRANLDAQDVRPYPKALGGLASPSDKVCVHDGERPTFKSRLCKSVPFHGCNTDTNGFPSVTSLVYIFLRQVMKKHAAFTAEKSPHLFPLQNNSSGRRDPDRSHSPPCTSHPRQEQLNLNHLSQELLTLLFVPAHTFFLSQP